MGGRRWRGLWWVVLLGAGPLPAAVYTVGAAGGYGSVQAAVDAANALPGAHEIRIRAQTVSGDTTINLAAGVTELRISGGWNASYTAQTVNYAEPGATRLSGAGLGTTLLLSYADARVTIDNLRIEDGAGMDAAGGLDASVGGLGTLQVQAVIVSGNSAQASQAAAGVRVVAAGSAQVLLRDCALEANTLVGSTGARGAALYALTDANAQLQIERCSVTGNSAGTLSGQAHSALYLNANGSSVIRLAQSDIGGNVANGLSAGASVFGLATQSAQILVEGVGVIQNTHPDASSGLRTQVYLSASDLALVRLSDSLLVRGPGAGATVQAAAGATARVTNLTVADHAGAGVLLSGAGTRSAYNNILHGNALGSILDTPTLGHNLGSDLGAADPQFVNAAALEYTVQAGSPAIDQGLASPPGGLGTLDVLGAARVQGTAVDIGAYERAVIVDAIHANGFE